MTRTNTASCRELSLTGIACHLIIEHWIQLQNVKPPSLTTFFQCDVYPFRFIVFFIFMFPSSSALDFSQEPANMSVIDVAR